MDHATVQRWLRTVLGPYNDRDRVFADVDRALIAVSSLSPKTEVFTFNDGRTQLLLNLEGTIPVDFRNTTYNIPVAYWLPRDYPREPPMAFVAPTPDMAVRKGPNVDPSGEIGGDYIARWRSKPEACNLLDLIHDCQHMFGREPPVYAKPKPTPVYATAASSQQKSQPSTPQQASSSTFAAQRSGPPPHPASPRSPLSPGGASFSTHDPRQKPPPPAPASGQIGSQHPAQGQQAPHRPSNSSSSMDAGIGYTQSPRNSLSNFEPYDAPQSPLHTGTSRFGGAEAYRRSSGAGFGPPPQQAQLASPVGPGSQQSNQDPRYAAGPAPHWQPRTYDHPAVHSPRRDSQQYLHHQQLHHQQQQRSQSYPYPQSDHHPNAGPRPHEIPQHAANQSPYNGVPAQHQQYQTGPPPHHHSNGATGPPVPGPHPYQPTHAAQMHAPGTNGYRDSPKPPPVAASKPKGINLLDDEEASVEPAFHSSNSVAPGAGGSAVPPPPRPINPELLSLHDRLFHKIDTRLSHLSSTLQTSNSRLELLSSDLDRGLPAIEDEMSRLKAVRDVCQTTGDRLESSVNEITESIRSLQAKEEPDPDSMVLATSIVGNQLVDLVAEDNAIEDTLYHLGRALNAERIDLDRFLKQTRMLAREQFMKRALAQKISEGMGWA